MLRVASLKKVTDYSANLNLAVTKMNECADEYNYIAEIPSPSLFEQEIDNIDKIMNLCWALTTGYSAEIFLIIFIMSCSHCEASNMKDNLNCQAIGKEIKNLIQIIIKVG